jgi:flagellar motor component MotA|tara:strand:- start:2443 stop:2628 length:186 start_codon:yes stop_codon:yes gene_type:complete
MYLGLLVSLIGIVLYDPLGLLFNSAGLLIIGLGLVGILFGYMQLNEIEKVNKAVENFEKNN